MKQRLGKKAKSIVTCHNGIQPKKKDITSEKAKHRSPAQLFALLQLDTYPRLIMYQ